MTNSPTPLQKAIERVEGEIELHTLNFVTFDAFINDIKELLSSAKQLERERFDAKVKYDELKQNFELLLESLKALQTENEGFRQRLIISPQGEARSLEASLLKGKALSTTPPHPTPPHADNSKKGK